MDSQKRIVVFSVLAALALITVSGASADDFFVITDLGNTFEVRGPGGDDGNGDGGAGGGVSEEIEAFVDGVGVSSRIVRGEYDGSIISGSQYAEGVEESITAYHDFDSSRAYYAAAESPSESLHVENFNHHYRYDQDDGRLVTIYPAGAQTLLDDGDMVLVYDNTGGSLRMRAHMENGTTIYHDFEWDDGDALYRLTNQDDHDDVHTMWGSVETAPGSPDTTGMYIVHSPYDLSQLEQQTVGPDRLYKIYEHQCSCRHYAFNGEQTFDVDFLAGTVDGLFLNPLQPGQDHLYYTMSYTEEISWTEEGRIRPTLHVQHNIPLSPLGENSLGENLYYTGTQEDGFIDIEQLTARNYMETEIEERRNPSRTYFNHTITIWDDYPFSSDVKSFTPENTIVSKVAPSPSLYSYIHLATEPQEGPSAAELAMQGHHTNGDFKAVGLPPNTAFKLVYNDGGLTLRSGLTSPQGEIAFDNGGQIFPHGRGKLYLYEGSPVYTGGAPQPGGMAFDHVNSDVLFTDIDGKLYNVHAYVKIPVTTGMEISGVSLDGRIDLASASGRYGPGDEIYLPIIPGYKTVHMTVGGLEMQMNIADILGTTGIQVTEGDVSTVSNINPAGFIDGIGAQTSVISHLIATTDGEATARVEAMVSGSSYVENTREFERIPPPPPPRPPRDPLTTWVEVYVNGELTPINGNAKTQIYFNNLPTTHHQYGVSERSSFAIADFRYPQILVAGIVKVPVEPGDFVEFYFYNEVYGEGEAPALPGPGYRETGRHAEARATSQIHYASIISSM